MDVERRYRAPLAMIHAVQLQYGLDAAQALAVYRAARRRARPGKRPIRAAAWDTWREGQQRRLLLDPLLHDVDAVAVIDQLADAAVPDPHTMAALRELDDRGAKARAAERRQLAAAAALRGVPGDIVRERYTQLRHQWLCDLGTRPVRHRPYPPAAWVRGFTSRDQMACSCPGDPATLYAMYRLQTDPQILPVASLGYAAVDLETAGPDHAAFDAGSGCIIEVGIVHYAGDGQPVSTYGQLIRPPQEADPGRGGYGTGATDVHGIRWQDVAAKPAWSDVAPGVAAHLQGQVMVAHNVRFERGWLRLHLSQVGCDSDPWAATVDTVALARQHRPDLTSFQLASVCDHFGVRYGDGHRAVHDATACGDVLFALRRALARDWQANPSRRRLEPPNGEAVPRPRSRCHRYGPGAPELLDDPWCVLTP